MSVLKSFPSSEEQNAVRNILAQVPFLPIIRKEETEKDYQLISSLICCFIDHMRLQAPQIDFDENILIVKFKFKFLIKI
jgi:hypothetical protein